MKSNILLSNLFFNLLHIHACLQFWLIECELHTCILTLRELFQFCDIFYQTKKINSSRICQHWQSQKKHTIFGIMAKLLKAKGHYNKIPTAKAKKPKLTLGNALALVTHSTKNSLSATKSSKGEPFRDITILIIYSRFSIIAKFSI